MINKDKFLKMYITMYFITVWVISYTSMNSPYMADNFHLSIILLSLVVIITSYYLIGFKYLVIWFKDIFKAAKKRSALRKMINDELRKNK